jgi:hypothetical protein
MRQLISAVSRRLFRPSEVIDGYEHPELIDVIFRKTLAYRPQGEWPEVKGASSVLDFGGGCGLHYKQANSPTVRWAVVETHAMVQRSQELATDRLRFFTSIADAADWLGSIDLMHSNGALQYTPDPEQTLRELCDLKAKQMLWHRVFLSDSSRQELQSSYLRDNGPGPIRVAEKMVRYPRISIPENAFLVAHSSYEIASRGKDWFRFVR